MNLLKNLSTNTEFILSLFVFYSMISSTLLMYTFSLRIYDMIDFLTLIIFSVIVGGVFSFLTMFVIIKHLERYLRYL